MPTPRFLTLDDVAEVLNVSWSQAYALVRRRELIAIQIGGRGQWRVEVDELERFIQRKYAEARAGAVPAAEELASAEAPAAGGDAEAETPAEAGPTRGRRSRR
ncbi:helix-turn-helix domain-containing protein [Geodermatophilus nigrescens]|uniref:DNA binding domain-containing protein, excisionase family n=1 Tax=Geodermatophilus nigrescens TaxID=1070870 RepID=A0A1M5NER9_9ACTN|nr:helix-turn-helix domain-containing protein [Geodermatophilus nigrescens]SHG87962.1 DNA binding domain-containing protein, excisionase family [Geodermatophilus nigrescens]